MYNIPLFELNYDERETKAVNEVLSSKWISTGPKCIQLEEKFCEVLNVRRSVSLTNCTAALHLSLLALGIGPGDEVIVPSFTFVATCNSVLYTGALPVFCDIKSSEDLNIDCSDIEQKITERTKAIIVMHFGGFPCDMDEITRIAEKNNLKVIEDACHGPLSEYKGKKVGTIGDIGCFSFFSNKNISSGEGGLIATNSDKLADKIKILRSHGMTTLSYDRAKGHSTSYDVIDMGYNYRLDDIRASLAHVQLEKLPEDIERRCEVRRRYISDMKNIQEIYIPFNGRTELCSNYIFPIVLKNADFAKRDCVRNALAKKGIQTSVHYPAAHRFSIYRECSTYLPKTDYATDCEITLPMYGSLNEEKINYICESLREILV